MPHEQRGLFGKESGEIWSLEKGTFCLTMSKAFQ
jgi:hypothetical protein